MVRVEVADAGGLAVDRQTTSSNTAEAPPATSAAVDRERIEVHDG